MYRLPNSRRGRVLNKQSAREPESQHPRVVLKKYYEEKDLRDDVQGFFIETLQLEAISEFRDLI